MGVPSSPRLLLNAPPTFFLFFPFNGRSRPPLTPIKKVTIRFRGPPLLDHVTCQIESSQRIGLLGRNGSGKTTLMRMMCGDVAPDSGQCVLSPGVKVALLPQDVPRDLVGTVEHAVLHGLAANELT